MGLTKAERADVIRDPVSFQETILKRKLTEAQKHIARSAATNRATAVKGCHGSGKTYVVSGAVLHHLINHPRGKVFTIAPTLRQVKLMWEEIEVARRASSIDLPECSTTGLRMTEERYGLGFSSSKGVNAQGMHGLDVLIIKDESPGISPEVSDAIEGIRMAGRVRVLDLGNPTVASGQFYDAFTPLVLQSLEAFGFCGRGESGAFTENGNLALGGQLPSNTSGGSLSEVYAHGFNLIIEAVRQIRGTSTAQVPDVKCSFVASSNCVPTGALVLRK